MIPIDSDAGADEKERDDQQRKHSLNVGGKHRVVSDPNTSKTQKPPTKRTRTDSTIIVLSSDNEQEPDFEPKPPQETDDENNLEFISRSLPKTEPQSKQSNVIVLCPLSKPGKHCDRCQVEKRDGGKSLSCHCGAKTIWLSGGRVRPAKIHWDTGQ